MTDSAFAPLLREAMRLLIVDDHPMTCEGLKSLLQTCYPKARIDTCRETSALAQDPGRWDYIFLDMHLPGVHFPHLLDTLTQHMSRIILISANPEPEIVERAKARGVRGLLLKNADAWQVLDGFRRIQTGEKVFVEFEPAGDGKFQPGTLTERQREVFDALLGGLSNKQIARKLEISEYTVKEHVTAILAIFGVRSRLALLLQQRHTVV